MSLEKKQLMSRNVKSGLVSIVVPSYNYARYIDQRMESLLNQTYHNLEIIVIDDCSTDNSMDVLRPYESDPRVTLVAREENGGWVTVNNQGVGLASGEFILFAQCDDTCDHRMVELLVEPLQSHPSAGISFCRSLLVDERGGTLGDDFDGRERNFKNLCRQDTLINRDQMVGFLFHACVIPNLSAALIRRNSFDVVGGFTHQYRVCGDWEWFFRTAEHFDVAYVAKPLNRFMQHEKTIRSVTKDRVVFEEYFQLLLSNLKMFKLSFFQRCRYRMRVMELWSSHLLSHSWHGLCNFPYHLGRIVRIDPVSLVFLPPALLLRMLLIIRKAIEKVVS